MRKLILASAAAATMVAGLGVASAALAQAGSYQRSCRNPQNVNGTLTAECADAQGQFHSTSINAGQCRGDIANANGALTCPGAQGSAGPVIGQGQQAQRGDNQRGFDNRGDNQRGDNRGNRRDDGAAAAVAGAVFGALLAPPPPPPPTYGDPRYGDPRYDWRYQQGGFGYGHRQGEWIPISERADWLNREIDHLQRDGRIDFRDARDYRRQLFGIQDRERQLMGFGRLGPRQRDELDHRFNDLTDEIRRDARED